MTQFNDFLVAEADHQLPNGVTVRSRIYVDLDAEDPRKWGHDEIDPSIYRLWAEGECYGFTLSVLDKGRESQFDSLWGHYGIDHVNASLGETLRDLKLDCTEPYFVGAGI